MELTCLTTLRQYLKHYNKVLNPKLTAIAKRVGTTLNFVDSTVASCAGSAVKTLHRASETIENYLYQETPSLRAGVKQVARTVGNIIPSPPNLMNKVARLAEVADPVADYVYKETPTLRNGASKVVRTVGNAVNHIPSLTSLTNMVVGVLDKARDY